ncbi:TIGR01841 family phasin [Paraburkholderia aromaticivorans]|uniref:TIGR01841 family phasin n=1 Tax=Paraburkholderia aromaticivorans TaxID=2026199 RepID=UPI001455F675|nr:TIGR01841 family phasin [Paraburkholderia aromaticivorans]
MNFLSPDQIAATQKASLDTMFGLPITAVEGFQKLVELNLQAFRATLVESQDNVLKALSVKTQQERHALPGHLMAPAVGKIQSYSSQVFAIMATMQTGFAKVAEAQYKARNCQMQTLVDHVGRNAPGGSEAVISAWETAITATGTLYEAVHQTTRQAVEVAGSNLSLAVTAASKAAQRSVEQASSTAKK